MKVAVVFGVAIAAVVCCGVATAKVHTLPKEMPLCQRSDDACLLKAIQQTLVTFNQGIPTLGVLPIDPLFVTELLIDQGSGPVGITFNFKDQDIIGISKAVITSVKSDFTDKKYHLEINADIPVVTLLGDYVVGGRVLVLPIQGAGRNNMTLINYKTKLILDGHTIHKGGEDYVIIDDIKVAFATTRLYVDLQNLFNGDKRLGDNMLVFLNENWEDILKELQPSIEEAMGIIYKEIANRLYSKIPYKKVHLE